MESNYDEDLSENTFFKVLQDEYYDLFEKATSEGWIICVPRSGSMPKYALTPNDFFSHILIPNDELPETHFRTLNDKEVRIFNRNITVDNDISSTFNTHILFEETYYTIDMLKYKVLCVESPLQQYADGVKTESCVATVQNLRDCIDLLWTEGSKELLEIMDDCIQQFLLTNTKLEFKSLEEQKDLVSSLYNKCIQIALKDSHIKEKTCNTNRHFLDNVRVSVESYIHHGIYKKLIKGISGCTADEDASLNKAARNLMDIQLKDLKIGPEFQSVIPKARTELRKVDGYSTVVGKVGCLKKALTAISNPDSSFSQNILAADELLPMLVFLVIKSGIPNWIAHLTFMKDFNLSTSNYHSNQHNFLITSLEAAITYIKTDLIVGPYDPVSDIIYDEVKKEEMKTEVKMKANSVLHTLFEMARIGNVEEVNRILGNNEKVTLGNIEGLKLCHPLCSCDKCEKELNFYLYNMNPTVNSVDERGFTVLHVAAMYGHAELIDLALTLGAKPNKPDYHGSTALHYASARGFQSILIILIHGGGRFDQPDNEGNTPLHLAALNGHESCVKALLYYTEQWNITYDINFGNNQGDTALHHASKWGYSTIVTLLTEYGANPFIENKRKLTPQDVAHNIHILDLLISFKNSKSSISSLNTSCDSEVALSSKSQLDFTDEDSETSTLSSAKKSTTGIRPNSTDGIKKIERVLRAITFGDVRLACFYLGLDLRSHESIDKPCHPLCPCRNKEDSDSSFGDVKVNEPMDVNVCNSDGFTPLHEASKCGRTELVKLLIEANADLNVRTRSTYMTPLHLACENSKTRIANLLIATKRIDINAKDSYNNTPLHYASQTNNIKLVKLLLDNNAICEVKNNKGKTPLDIAKDYMLLSTVQLLMAHSHS